MEESKTTSEFVFEDDHSFITQEHEVVLKPGDRHGERKIAEVDNTVEETVQELKNAFSKLEEKVETLEAQESVSAEECENLRNELDKAKAIGNYDNLYARLDGLQENTQDKKDSEQTVDEQQEPVDEKEDTETTETNIEEQPTDQGKTEDFVENKEQEEESDEKESSIDYYKEILDKAKDLAQQNDWSYVGGELDNLSHKWSEGPDLDSEEVGKLYQKFTKVVQDFEKRKEEHFEQQKKRKQGNLSKKIELLNRLEEIVYNKQWTATGKVGSIKGKWGSVGTLPEGKGEELDEKFKELISTFEDHKVDRLVQKRQQEEDNLMLKLSVLDKMEKVTSSIDHETENWKEIDEKFEDLTTQWKKIGRVPKEKSNEVWERYKSAQDEYYDNKYKYDRKHQSRVDKFRSKKEKICKKAEQLLEMEDIAKAAQKINKLHRQWKKVGNLPQRDEDELWNRFKAATDAFNERKSQNMDKLREQEEEHYRQKLKLIEEAEAIKGTDDFEKGHRKMQSLMDKWKAIGPVPRKKSNEIWKQFKGAMDVFYDRRREHFKEQKEDRKENLEEKQQILEELKELGQHEDPIEAVNIAKKLQARFKDVGYVPIKKKNEMWKKYREACDVIYDRYRAAKSGDKFDQELAKADLNANQRSKIQDMRKEYKKVKKEVSKLENEKLKYEETKTYFKPSDEDNALMEEVQQKIETVENKLQKKQGKLDTLTREMEEIKEKA